MVLSEHFKHSLKLLGLAIVVLIGGWLWLQHRIRAFVSSYKSPTVLANNVKERISFNEKTHTLIVETPKKTIKEYAHNPEVLIMKDDTVVIKRHLIGFENQFFVGVGYADCGRVFVGDNFFHFSRFDLSGSVGIAPDTTKTVLQPFVAIGYNFYSNTSINLGLNPLHIGLYGLPEVGGFVSIKF